MSSSRIVCQFASTSAIQGKRSFGKKVASPTSDLFPINRSIGVSPRSPTAIVNSTVRSHSDFCDPVVTRYILLRPAGSSGLCGLSQCRHLWRLRELLQRPLLQLGGPLGGESEP